MGILFILYVSGQVPNDIQNYLYSWKYIWMLRKYYVPHPKILDDSIDESWSLVSLNYFLIGMFEKLQ